VVIKTDERLRVINDAMPPARPAVAPVADPAPRRRLPKLSPARTNGDSWRSRRERDLMLRRGQFETRFVWVPETTSLNRTGISGTVVRAMISGIRLERGRPAQPTVPTTGAITSPAPDGLQRVPTVTADDDLQLPAAHTHRGATRAPAPGGYAQNYSKLQRGLCYSDPDQGSGLFYGSLDPYGNGWDSQRLRQLDGQPMGVHGEPQRGAPHIANQGRWIPHGRGVGIGDRIHSWGWAPFHMAPVLLR